MVVVAVYSTIAWAVEQAPRSSDRPVVADRAVDQAPDRLPSVADDRQADDRLGAGGDGGPDADSGSAPDDGSAAVGPVWPTGILRVGPAEDPQVARRDRDIVPSEPVFEIDPRLLDLGLPELTRSEFDEIPPGLYASSPTAEGCSYELWQVQTDRRGHLIGEEHLGRGPLLASINEFEPDWFVSSPQCGRWAPWVPRAVPLTEVSDGDYWIGDLAIGLWFVPDDCRWEEVVSFRGGQLVDVVASAVGPGVLIVDEETVGIRVRSCDRPIVHSTAVN